MGKTNPPEHVRHQAVFPPSPAIGQLAGFASTAFFALYNGILGAYHTSLWYGSICVYYLLLSLLRGLLLAAERKEQSGAPLPPRQQRRAFYLTSGMILLLNVTLVVPLALMVLDQRPVSVGMIPAIASAAYATYKIVAAMVGFRRHKASSLFTRELALLRLVDALVSILVLQNTLITAVDGEISSDMFRLSAITSGGIFLVCLGLSLAWLARCGKETGVGKFLP